MTECFGIRIDRKRQSASRNGRSLALTAAELRLLARFLLAPGHTLSRKQLLEAITEGYAVVTKRTVDVHVCALRRKLGPPELIKTIRGVGYRFEADTEPLEPSC